MQSPLLGDGHNGYQGRSDEAEDEDLEMQETPVQPFCLGRSWHWSEGLFFITLCVGLFDIITQDMSFSIPNEVMDWLYIGAAVTGCALIWNLVSIKRLAAATDFLAKDVKRLKTENARARTLQSNMKKQDVKMKQNLSELNSASLLLKGSCQGLEGVAKEEKQMIADQQQLLEQRKKVAEDLTENLQKLWKLSIDAAQQEAYKRATEIFDDLADEDEKTGEFVIHVRSEKFNKLNLLMKEYGIDTDVTKHNGVAEDLERLKKFAGEDLTLTSEEFEQWLHAELQNHFELLTASLLRSHQMEQEIKTMENKGKRL